MIAVMFNLALFPLNTVLFPGMPLQLHIFEPRYQTLIRQCLDTHQPFGVVLIHQGLEAYGPLATPVQVGCAARIINTIPLEGGRMNLTAVGDERFRIIKLNYEQPFLVGEVESVPIERPSSIEIARGTRQLAPWVSEYLRLVNQVDPDHMADLGGIDLPEDPLVMLYLAASILHVPATEKQALLEATYANELLAKVVRLYRRETAVMRKVKLVSLAYSLSSSRENSAEYQRSSSGRLYSS
jgi:Lon protease-like protein